MNSLPVLKNEVSSSRLETMKKEKGTTLVEILIVTVVVVAVGTMLMGIWINNNGVFNKQDALVGEGVSLNDTLRQIDDTIREAAGVVESYELESKTYTTGDNVLVVKLPALSPSGVISNVYDYLVVSLDSSPATVLRLQLIPDVQSTRQAKNQVLSTIVKSIGFEYLDDTGSPVDPISATKVKVTLLVNKQNGSIGSSRVATMTASLRNIP